MKAKFHPQQQAALESYGDHCIENPSDVPGCGDGLLQFVLREVSPEEDCESFEQAARRMDTAIEQLTAVRDAMLEKAEV